MTRSISAVRGGLLAAAATLALGVITPPATAQDSDSGNWLFVTVTRGDGRHGASTPGNLLLCDPPQGHAHAAEACADLDRVGGDIGRLRQKDAFCPMIYAPVTAQARGEWDGHPVDYRETFSNGCGLAAQTGAVFAVEA